MVDIGKKLVILGTPSQQCPALGELSVVCADKRWASKECGATFKQLKTVFGIDRQTYTAWVKLRNETGSVIPEQIFRSRLRKIDKEALRKAVEKKPDAYLSELAALFQCSIPAVFYALKKMKITLKKRRSPMPKNPKKNEPNS